MMKVEPTKEHAWLQQLVGNWTFEVDGAGCPDAPAKKLTGAETVRSVGGLWLVAEGRGEMPGGGMANTMLTLGYDPKRKRMVGTWLGSMMTHLWVYEGSLDVANNVLTLNTEGPAFDTKGAFTDKTAQYREVVHLETPDYRTFTSSVLGEDGTWTQMMTAHYRRAK